MLNYKDIIHFKEEDGYINEIKEKPRQGPIVTNNFKEFFQNEDYENYIVDYSGDIIEAINKLDYAAASKLGPIFAIVVVKKGMLNNLLKDTKEIIYAQKSYPYILSGLDKVLGSNNYKFISDNDLGLNGEGVVVGIIGTGIDYLNQRFTNENNKTRIISIWDQTLEEGPPPPPIVTGTEYTSEKINEAIIIKNRGGDPYSVVKHKDDSGHGTAIAGIIGGRKLSIDDPFVSVAPKCEFAIVKLKKAKKSTIELNGIEKTDAEVYGSADIRTAILYLTDLQAKLNKPMVIYIPLGTNSEGHDGLSPIERYIDYYSDRKGLDIVVDTGSQGVSETHTSGYILNTGSTTDIEINVGENQKNLFITTWFKRPDEVSVGITTPNGTTTGKIPFNSSTVQREELEIEGSKALVEYYISYTNGVEYVNILIRNVNSGVWKINLFGDYIVDGRYDAWLLQRELLQPDTKCMNPDPLITLTVPSTSLNSLTTSYYDTSIEKSVPKAGKGFTRDGRIKPDVCIAGTNILTTCNNGENVLVSGAAAAGAILTGATVLIVEWGIVHGNDKTLFTPKIKTYLVRSTVRSQNENYPNPQCGYGMLDFDLLFKNLKAITRNVNSGDEVLEQVNMGNMKTLSSIYIRVPTELLDRVNTKSRS